MCALGLSVWEVAAQAVQGVEGLKTDKVKGQRFRPQPRSSIGVHGKGIRGGETKEDETEDNKEWLSKKAANWLAVSS